MYDKFYKKFNYSGEELEKLKDVLNQDFILSEKITNTAYEFPKGYGYTTLGINHIPLLLSKIKAAAPCINQLIEENIFLAEYFYGKKILSYKISRIFCNKFFKGCVVSKHKHGSIENNPLLVLALYIYSESDSGNLILHTEEQDIVIPLSPGDLVVHPGYIPHSVSEYKGNIPRLGLIYEYSLKFD